VAPLGPPIGGLIYFNVFRSLLVCSILLAACDVAPVHAPDEPAGPAAPLLAGMDGGCHHEPPQRSEPVPLPPERGEPGTGTVELAIALAIPAGLPNTDRYALGAMTPSEIEQKMLENVERANLVWRGHGVQFVVADVIHNATYPTNVDENSVMGEFASIAAVPAIMVYPVADLNANGEQLGGFAVKDAEGCAPFVLLDIGASSLVLAHEFGHVVGLAHADHLRGNLMEHIVGGSDLTLEQRARAWETSRIYSTHCGM